jgi:hypothetical protein
MSLIAEAVQEDTSIIGIGRPEPPPLGGQPYGRRKSDKIPWAGALLLSIGILLMFFGKTLVPTLFGTAVPFELSATDVKGQMHIRWNGQADDVTKAENAILEVTDGKQQYIYPVSHEVLESGTLDYTRRTDDVVATLVLHKNGHETERRIVRSISAPTGR